MRNAMLLGLIAVICLSSVGCQVGPIAGVVPPPGYILTDIKAPLSANNQGVTIGGAKVGKAEVKQYIWIVTTGDCSLMAAAKDAGITKVTYADYEYFTVLSGIFSRFCVVVHGD